MRPKRHSSRRHFLAASSAILGAGSLRGQDEKDAPAPASRLALHGGPKAVREPLPRLVRWGEPERARLNALLEQDSLFYWKGPQTTLLIERFRRACPLRHVMPCSSQAAVAAAQLGRLEGIAQKRARLGGLLTEGLAGVPGVEPHQVRPDDRCTYWFYMLRIWPGALRCDRAEFVKALAAEGVPASSGYIPVPLYGNPIFREHGFFAGRWPVVKQMGLTAMDYAKVSCPEAEAILETGVRLVIHEGMSEAYVRSMAAAVRKVTDHYAS